MNITPCCQLGRLYDIHGVLFPTWFLMGSVTISPYTIDYTVVGEDCYMQRTIEWASKNKCKTFVCKDKENMKL